ncbi:MAG: hypothetical protein ACREHG_07180 [Candidatus Saccharimonadales bacterium]
MIQFWLKHSFCASGIMAIVNDTGNRMILIRFSSASRSVSTANRPYQRCKITLSISSSNTWRLDMNGLKCLGYADGYIAGRHIWRAEPF